jgi:outer membrane immunogenic protein
MALLPLSMFEDFDASQFGSNFKSFGWSGGVQAGYNLQTTSNFLIGVEADFNWTGLSARDGHCISSPSQCEQPPNIIGRGFASGASRLDYLTTLRARFGLLHEDTLAYVTAGPALGGLKSEYSISDPASQGGALRFSATDSSNRFGLAVGAGIEHMLTESLLLRAEYLYASLASGTFHGNCTAYGTLNGWCAGGAELNRLSYGNSFSANFARVGLNYLFNK